MVGGPDALTLARKWTEGLEEAELPIPSGFVAEIRQKGRLRARADGSVELTLEALTIRD